MENYVNKFAVGIAIGMIVTIIGVYSVNIPVAIIGAAITTAFAGMTIGSVLIIDKMDQESERAARRERYYKL